MMNMQSNRTVSRSPYETPTDWSRARNILAKSFYKELKGNGLTHRQIVELSNELLQMVSDDFQKGESVW